ncbi:MAG: extracellular solute-binding protein [Butyrivibrio sp.]|nr:extracellular solute-binding protein [Butyrivibrio sp.]
MPRNKKIIAFLSSILLLMLTVSCGRDVYMPFMNNEAARGIDFSRDPVTITYLTIGDKPSNGMTEKAIERLNRILTKRLNAKLDIYFIGWSDYLSNYKSVLESDEIELDLVGTSADWLSAWQLAINGSFMPLSEDMLRNYCGITFTNVTAAEWQSCSYQGNIYFIPENEYTQWTNHGFAYRKDIASRAGLDEVSSFDDMDRYFEYVTRFRPEMIPWDISEGNTNTAIGYIMSNSSYAPIYELSAYGIWGEYADNKGKIVSPYYVGNELVEYARLMKKWNDIGVWREDLSLAEDNDAAFYRGGTSVVQDHTENYYKSISPQMKIAMPETELGFFWFGKESGNLMKISNLHGAMAVSRKSKNPERALMVYDLLRNNEECYRLLRYGIEGVQYELTEDGLMEKPSGYNEDDQGIVTNFWWGRRDEFEIPDSFFSWDEYYALTNSYDHIAKKYPWDGVPFSTPMINSEVERIAAVFDRYMPLISTGKYEEEPEVIVEQFREDLMKAGIERVTGQLQRIYNSQ